MDHSEGERHILSYNKIGNNNIILGVLSLAVSVWGILLAVLFVASAVCSFVLDPLGTAVFLAIAFKVAIVAAPIAIVVWLIWHVFRTIVRDRNRVHFANENFMATSGDIKVHHHEDVRTSYNIKQVESAAEPMALPPPSLPTYVPYEQVKGKIPRGHALLGVAADHIETRLDYVRALVWIVGSSGTGKTNSTVIRMNNDVDNGHKFLVVDPHAFKPDSLSNSIRGYRSHFMKPIAQALPDIESVLDVFMGEFYARKGGRIRPPYKPITLIIDEVGSLTVQIDTTDAQAVSVLKKIKKIAQICGTESRNFEMYGMMISQTAAGLAWLRNVALLVIAHQLNMMSERELACNKNMEIARSMDTWPKGRSLVYGVGITEGQLVLQQPVSTVRAVDADHDTLPDLPPNQWRYPSPQERNIDEIGYTHIQPVEPMETEEIGEVVSLSSGQKEKIAKILEMDARQAGQNEIIQTVWQVNPAHRVGQVAAKELRLIRAYIAQKMRSIA